MHEALKGLLGLVFPHCLLQIVHSHVALSNLLHHGQVSGLLHLVCDPLRSVLELFKELLAHLLIGNLCVFIIGGELSKSFGEAYV